MAKAWRSMGNQLGWLMALKSMRATTKEIKVVNKRLALAGLRLAAVLNEAFAPVQH
jgi:hypothetical protein